MMHEVSIRSINVSESVRFGFSKFDHGEDQARVFGKGSLPARMSAPKAWSVPSGVVLALLL